MFVLFFSLATKGEIATISKQEILLKKIQKKYGEWMVETKAKPVRLNTKVIPVSSLDDLSKDFFHSFYVVDENSAYEYILKTESVTNQVFCPKCGFDVYLRGVPGEKIEATCPQCEYRGVIEIQSIKKGDPVHRIISYLTK